LIDRGHQVAVFCREGNPERSDYEIEQDVFDGLAVRRVVNNYQEMKGAPLHTVFHLSYRNERIESLFEDYLDEFQPEVVHVEHCRGLSASILETLRRRKVPHVLTLRDYWYLCQRVNLLRGDGSLCDGPMGGILCGRCQGLSSIDATAGDLRQYRLARTIMKVLPPRVKKHFIPRWHRIVRVPLDKAYFLRVYADRTFYLMDQVRKTRHLTASSTFARDVYVRHGVSKERFALVPHGVDVERWKRFERKSSPVLRFGFLGTLLPSKGAHWLIEAYRRMRDPTTSLTLFGDVWADPAYVDRIRRVAQECGATIAGRYDNSRLPEILSRIDVLVVPSLWHETYGFVVREGQLSGAPIIASRIGALPEAIREDVDGFLVEPGDSNELAEKMRRFVEDPGLLHSMREQVRSRIVTIEENAEMIERVYQEAMS
jgi:glycosyltransferase involved in cell wall biosynthesis